MPPSFNFSTFPKSLHIHFQFGLTVPQKLNVLVCKTSCMSREEKTLPMYTSYQTFLISVECHVTVAWTTNIAEVACFMPLPERMEQWFSHFLAHHTMSQQLCNLNCTSSYSACQQIATGLQYILGTHNTSHPAFKNTCCRITKHIDFYPNHLCFFGVYC
jgi:hypothetical protein